MKIEVLAPGGSLDSVKAAINAGADAVYTGGQMFGAREYADNLNTDQMLEALQYAHIHGRRIYLTVNTLLKDKEIEEKLYNYLLPFYENGLDAVIVQDFGVMKYIHESFSDLPIHASTQMTIMGEKTAIYLKEYGVTRIVTPRELNLQEIKKIYDSTHMEIESFVHGALCYCYSGQCFLSSYIGGRSGNRGKCAQPCRLNYDVIKEGEVLNKGNNKYILSPKDICTLRILPDIIEAGVCSLKIEGRMKKTEYTAGITALYRKYLDLYLEKGREGYYVSDDDMQKALDLFNRNGFNESYFKVHNGKEMISMKKPTFRMENTELVKNIRENYINVEPKENINIYITILKEKNINLVVTCKDLCVDVVGGIPQEAKNTPLRKETVIKQLSKLGNTPYDAEHIEVTMDEELFLTIGELNAIRRRMTDKLTKELISKKIRNNINNKKADKDIEEKIQVSTLSGDNNIEIAVLVTGVKQALAAMEDKAVIRVYIEAYSTKPSDIEYLLEKKDNNTKIYLSMPHIFRAGDEERFNKWWKDILYKVDGFLIRNIEAYFYLEKLDIRDNIIFDYNLYTFNKNAKLLVNKISSKVKTTVPVEQNYKELCIRGCKDEEMVVYGYMPVMFTANCIAKTCGRCNKQNDHYQLRDRMSQVMNVKCICNYCYNIIYNTNPLSLIKYNDEIKTLGVGSVRLEFTVENTTEIKGIISKYKHSFIDGSMKVEEINNSTRGHFKRGVK